MPCGLLRRRLPLRQTEAAYVFADERVKPHQVDALLYLIRSVTEPARKIAAREALVLHKSAIAFGDLQKGQILSLQMPQTMTSRLVILLRLSVSLTMVRMPATRAGGL